MILKNGPSFIDSLYISCTLLVCTVPYGEMYKDVFLASPKSPVLGYNLDLPATQDSNQQPGWHLHGWLILWFSCRWIYHSSHGSVMGFLGFTHTTPPTGLLEHETRLTSKRAGLNFTSIKIVSNTWYRDRIIMLSPFHPLILSKPPYKAYQNRLYIIYIYLDLPKLYVKFVTKFTRNTYQKAQFLHIWKIQVVFIWIFRTMIFCKNMGNKRFPIQNPTKKERFSHPFTNWLKRTSSTTQGAWICSIGTPKASLNASRMACSICSTSPK